MKKFVNYDGNMNTNAVYRSSKDRSALTKAYLLWINNATIQDLADMYISLDTDLNREHKSC